MDLTQNYFTLFGLPAVFRLDMTAVEQAYLAIQSEVHPDRFAQMPESDRRRSMQWAARANEAYRTLRQPLERAKYLLQLAGVDVGSENNLAMSPEFLMEQMEWREAVSEARAAADVLVLDRLHQRIREQVREMFLTVEHHLDEHQDVEAAADSVRRLMFMTKLQSEIDDAIVALENE